MVSRPQLTDGVILLNRLRLRDAMAHLAGEDEEQARRFGWYPARSTLEGVRSWIREHNGDWVRGGATRVFAVREASTGILVGGCEVRLGNDQGAEMSYWTFPAYRSRGFATRAVLLASAFAFAELGVERVELQIEPDNLASLAVACKAGFIEQGRVSAQLRLGGEWREMLRYRRFHSQSSKPGPDYKKSKAAPIDVGTRTL